VGCGRKHISKFWGSVKWVKQSGANFGEKDRNPGRRKYEQETHMIKILEIFQESIELESWFGYSRRETGTILPYHTFLW
jgi:hypothetical protein